MNAVRLVVLVIPLAQPELPLLIPAPQVLIMNVVQLVRNVQILVRAVIPYLTQAVVTIQQQPNAEILVINLRLVVQILVRPVLDLTPVPMPVKLNAEIAVITAQTVVLLVLHLIPVRIREGRSAGLVVILVLTVAQVVQLPSAAVPVILKHLSAEPNVALAAIIAQIAVLQVQLPYLAQVVILRPLLVQQNVALLAIPA